MFKMIVIATFGLAIAGGMTLSADDNKTYDIAKAARAELLSLFNNTGKQAILDTIEIRPVTETEIQESGHWFSAIRFDVYINNVNQKRFQAGAVGVGTTQEDSRKQALTIWLGTFATAFEKALVQAPERKRMNGFIVSPGVAIGRGEIPPNCWLISDNATDQMMSSLEPFLRNFRSKELVVLLIAIYVDASGKVDGDCRINGDVKGEILTLLRKTNLPKSGGAYMFKQYLILESEMN